MSTGGRIHGGAYRGTWLMLALASLSLLAGCSPVVAPDAKSYAAEARVAAIVRTVNTQDRAALPALVTALDDEDAAVRVYATEALRRMTGQTMGYRPSDPPETRAIAVQRWRHWLIEQGAVQRGSPVVSTESKDRS